jgi:hypothetical protein
LEKTPKSPKPSLLQNHHCKTNIGTKLIAIKHTQNSLILIRGSSFDEERWQKSNNDDRKNKEEDRIKESQM